jgi:uncharacterized repeat protein (TIGR03803 family)
MSIDNILHSFRGIPYDGDNSSGLTNLTLANDTIYGITYTGGTIPFNPFGTIFKINPDGTGYTVLYSISIVETQGINFSGQVVLVNSILYGTLLIGPVSPPGFNNGVIFSVNTDGTNYQNLHYFGAANDGSRPLGGIVLYSSTLYGTTQNGNGTSANGTVFKIQTDQTGYTILYAFQGGSDGAIPECTVVVSPDGSFLYGVTSIGGTGSVGTIFKVDTVDGSQYQKLYDFQGGSDGANPIASLILGTDGFLYGVTNAGGSANLGTVFKINTDGTGYNIIYNFQGIALGDGANPQGSLVLGTGDTLYGTTSNGGTANLGTRFKINTNGTGYKKLYDFQGGSSDGANPQSNLIVYNDNLIGMTNLGGTYNLGTIYSGSIPAPPVSNICFPAGTPVKTDQGIVPIEYIDITYHTINQKEIKCVTETRTIDRFLVRFKKNSLGMNYPYKDTIMTKDHKVKHNGKLLPAMHFAKRFSNVTFVKYRGEILYNVLLENYSTMNINNLICETLHPDNIIAKLYTNRFTEEYNHKVVDVMNYSLFQRDLPAYKRIIYRASN